MAFDIDFNATVEVEGVLGEAAIEGEIVLGAHRETFSTAIGYWSPTDYRYQWERAIDRVVKQRLPACLVTSIQDPAETTFLVWWLLYPSRDVVYVQNALLLYEQLRRPFDSANPYEAIPLRRTATDEGQEISEWQVIVSDLAEYLQRVGRNLDA